MRDVVETDEPDGVTFEISEAYTRGEWFDGQLRIFIRVAGGYTVLLLGILVCLVYGPALLFIGFDAVFGDGSMEMGRYGSGEFALLSMLVYALPGYGVVALLVGYGWLAGIFKYGLTSGATVSVRDGELRWTEPGWFGRHTEQRATADDLDSIQVFPVLVDESGMFADIERGTYEIVVITVDGMHSLGKGLPEERANEVVERLRAEVFGGS